jgi:hypothetical protein
MVEKVIDSVSGYDKVPSNAFAATHCVGLLRGMRSRRRRTCGMVKYMCKCIPTHGDADITRQMRIEFKVGEKKYKPTCQHGEGCFFFLSLSFHYFVSVFCLGKCCENSELLASLVNVLEKAYPHPCPRTKLA